MESQNTAQAQQSVTSQLHTKPCLIVIVSLLTLLVGGAGGYFLAIQSSSKQVTEVSIQPSQAPSNAQNTDQLSNVTYLTKYRDGGPSKERTIFLTKDGTGEALKLSDINMSEASTKTLHKFDFPAVVGFNPPLHVVSDYIVAPVTGADANDILIFSLNGDVISKGVRQGNADLSNWIVTYDEWVKDNVIKVKLFQIDNSTGTAQIDLTTGRMVPGTYIKLGKLQQ
jgi:hypothetical protein